MIQRIQTIFLFDVVVLLIVLLFVPVVSVTFGTTPAATRTLLQLPILLAGEILLAVVALATIMLFKNRRLQIRLSMLGALLSAALLGALVAFPVPLGDAIVTNGTSAVAFEIGTYLLALNIIFFLLAARFIRKDEALVRSADRLR